MSSHSIESGYRGNGEFNDRPILITGAAGFIGARLSERLLHDGYRVVGVDNFNDYYDPELKEARVRVILDHASFTLARVDLCDMEKMAQVFNESRPAVVINLAAQAGVRYSIENPVAYFSTNVSGFFNVLELCRRYDVEHLIYASSSSVYGESPKVPFEESDKADEPVSFYAATKRCNELMASAYCHNHGVSATGLRFFTVYGPRGRPDMAYYAFTDKYFRGEAVTVYNAGGDSSDLSRDFTYIDDVVEGVVQLVHRPPSGPTPHSIYNVGNSSPVKLTQFIEELEEALTASLGRHAVLDKVYAPLQAGDVTTTYASTQKLEELTGYRPNTPLRVGLQAFTDWYVDFHGIR